MAATVTLRFYAELSDHLSAETGWEVECAIDDLAQVGGLIEDLGVPLSEVDLIVVGGQSVGPGHRVGPGDRVGVYPVFEAFDVGRDVKLRERPLRVTRFLIDAGLEPLAGLLAARGHDTRLADRPLTDGFESGGRIVLTKDPAVISTHGLAVQAEAPADQLAEVVERLHLSGSNR